MGFRLRKETPFLKLTIMVAPKPTLIFNPESDKEPNWAIQMAVDMQAHLNHLNKELWEMNHQADAVKSIKAEHQWEQQWLSEEQAEKDQLAAVAEKAKKDWLEQLEQVNHKVSPDVSIWNLVLATWSGSCEDAGSGGAGG